MPKSQAENDFLAGVNRKVSRAGDAVTADIWLGGSDQASEGTWRWLDGSPISSRSGICYTLSVQIHWGGL